MKLNDASSFCPPRGIISQLGGAHESPSLYLNHQPNDTVFVTITPFPVLSAPTSASVTSLISGFKPGQEEHSLGHPVTIVKWVKLTHDHFLPYLQITKTQQDTVYTVCVCACVQDANLSSMQVGVLGACVVPQQEIQCLAEMLQGLAYKYL